MDGAPLIQRLTSTATDGRWPEIGPDDSGRLMTLEEFGRAREIDGYTYELIDGVLIVSPAPKPNHATWVREVQQQLEVYSERHPNQINFVVTQSEVVIPGRPGATRPQPDVAAFRDFPSPPPGDWGDVCPIIVVEVISQRRDKKDTVRNRHLYWMAGGIMEYWIVDPREDSERPALITCVRPQGSAEWAESVTPFGKTFKSPTLRGLSVNLGRKPRRK